MRKIGFVFIIVLLLFLGACKKEPNVYTLSLNDNEVSIYIGDTYNLEYTATLNNKEADLDLNFTITSPDKIEINGSTFKGLKEGSCLVMVSLQDDASVVKNFTITILNPLKITNTVNTCYLGSTLQITVVDLRAQARLGVLTWDSANPTVASVDENGLVSPLKIGETLISVESAEGLKGEIRVYVQTPDLEEIEISYSEGLTSVDVLDEVTLLALPLPQNADNLFYWESSNPAVATISSAGLLSALSTGEVTITVSSIAKPNIKATLTIEVKMDPLKIFQKNNIENVMNSLVTSYGASERTQTVYGSVNNFFFTDLNIIEDIAPFTMVGGTGLTNTYVGQTATPAMLTEAEPKKFTRSGILHPATTYITYHDTGNNTPGAGAIMHSTYLKGSGNLTDRARSWHYTVDSNTIVHHIPNNEVTWQGDNYTSYAYSIGIETAVDYGSDLYATWQRTAKLIASLMLEYNIPFSNIKQHFDWNGKNCPQTLRRNDLYPLAMEMVKTEFFVAKYLADYSISFTSLNPEILNNQGRVISLPSKATRVAYIVRVSKDDYDKSLVLYANVPGADGSLSPEVKGTSEDLNEAKIFDQGVANLNSQVTKADFDEIKAMRIAYNCLTETQRDLTLAHGLLEEYELALHALDAVETPIVISEFLSSNNDILSHGYVELFNPTNNDISLNGYSLQYNNNLASEVYAFSPTAVIRAKSYFLVSFQTGNNENATLLPLPDGLCNINLGKSGFIVLAKNTTIVNSAQESNVVDFVGMKDSLHYEGSAPTNAILDNFATKRKGLIDTNQNAFDFVATTPQPTNASKESINEDLSPNEVSARKVDFLILNLPLDLSLSDESKVTNARAAYDLLEAPLKALVKCLSYLEAAEDALEDLIDPNYKAVNQALRAIPRQIVNDFPLPSGVVWTYKAGQDQSYFDLTTGKYLKVSYEAKYITLVATNNSASKEVTINFGILKEGQTALFYTGKVAPLAGGSTGEGKGTASEQEAKVGFSGIALVVEDKVLFVAEKSYISLTNPLTGNLLGREALRPYGSSADTSATFNQSLVKGVPTGYEGSGTLYKNDSNIDLVFDPSNTYGRNNSGAYGYAKVVFSPNGDGTYTIQQAWDNSGDNTTSLGTTKTLKPGELLWCPHTYETNLTYGTWFMQPGTATNGTPVLVIGKTLETISFKTKFN